MKRLQNALLRKLSGKYPDLGEHTMELRDLCGCRVVDKAGEEIGEVIDLTASSDAGGMEAMHFLQIRPTTLLHLKARRFHFPLNAILHISDGVIQIDARVSVWRNALRC